MMLSYNSVKCVICHNSGLESISKFFRLVINGVYIGCFMVGKTRLLLQEAKGCIRYMGQDMTKDTLWLYLSKSRLCCLCKVLL